MRIGDHLAILRGVVTMLPMIGPNLAGDGLRDMLDSRLVRARVA